MTNARNSANRDEKGIHWQMRLHLTFVGAPEGDADGTFDGAIDGLVVGSFKMRKES